MPISEEALNILKETLDVEHATDPGHQNEFSCGKTPSPALFELIELRYMVGASDGNGYKATTAGMAQVFGSYSELLKERNELLAREKLLDEVLESAIDVDENFYPSDGNILGQYGHGKEWSLKGLNESLKVVQQQGLRLC